MNMSRTCAASLRFHILVMGTALLALTAVGCGRRGNVSGKVTYKDKPLVCGTVLLHGRDGLRQGNIEPDGSYTVLDVASGEARVAVNSPNPKSIDVYPGKKGKKAEPYPDAPGWFPIPKEYEKIETSGLTYTI